MHREEEERTLQLSRVEVLEQFVNARHLGRLSVDMDTGGGVGGWWSELVRAIATRSANLPALRVDA